MQIVVIAFEHRMLFDLDHHIQIAGRSAVDAMLAFAGEANAVAFVHAGGDFYRQGFMLFHPARAVARGTGIGDGFAAAVTSRAGLLNREKALLHAYLAVAATHAARGRLGAGLSAGAFAGLAHFHGGNADFGFGAARGFFERNF